MIKWSKVSNPGAMCTKRHVRGATPFGMVYITEEDGVFEIPMYPNLDGGLYKSFSSFEEGMEICNKEYARQLTKA